MFGCEDETVYVGKLEFIREYHEVNETEKIVEQLLQKEKQA
jgi:Cd2+/Zn2+-exporting ATPase